MRHTLWLLLLVYLVVFTLFLGQNLPERSRTDPQSMKERIGVWTVIPVLKDGVASEAVSLFAILLFPMLMINSLIIAAGANRKLRAQIARMDRREVDAGAVVLNAGLDLATTKYGLSELSGDSMEAQLLGIESDHGDVRRSLEHIEREHAERTSRMQDKAQALALQINDTTRRVTALRDGDEALAAIVTETQTLRRELDTALAENEGEGNLAELLIEAERGMDGFDSRIEALETLKPKVIEARDRFTALVERLKTANDDGGGNELWEAFKELKSNVDSFDEDDLKPAETDEDGNDLSGELDNLPDLGDFETRITALAELTIKVIAERAKLEELKTRLEAANGDKKDYLSAIFEALKTGVDELDTEVTTAGQDENENELEDELANIDLDDITTRIEALEGLLPKVLAAKQELEALRTRLTLVASIDIDEEIGALQRGIERLGKVLEPLEEGDIDSQTTELDEIGTELPELTRRFEALRQRLTGA